MLLLYFQLNTALQWPKEYVISRLPPEVFNVHLNTKNIKIRGQALLKWTNKHVPQIINLSFSNGEWSCIAFGFCGLPTIWHLSHSHTDGRDCQVLIRNNVVLSKVLWYWVTYIHNLGYSILPKDAIYMGPGEPGIKPVTLQLLDDPPSETQLHNFRCFFLPSSHIFNFLQNK